MYRAKYDCIRKGRVYFGKRYAVELFGQSLHAYVMIDRERALREYEEYRVEHEKEFDAHTDGGKLWDSVRFGFFALLSNIEADPQEILKQYLDRVLIEEVFRDTKSFEHLMPLSKWTAESVKGKLLSDMIDTILRCLLLKEIPKFKGSLMDLFYEAAGISCFIQDSDQLGIDTPNKQARAAFKLFELKVPSYIDLAAWKSTILPR
ncbi:MAG: hypothetical protein HDQ87_01420 [Clostridia bacterium]|nr:hypothetical protein [Clostridia bacterium]